MGVGAILAFAPIGQRLFEGEYTDRFAMLAHHGRAMLARGPHNHRTSRAPKDVLPSRMCAHYCAPCQPLLRVFLDGFDLHLLHGPSHGAMTETWEQDQF